ncbi:MAG: carbamoyltransferase HypF [Thermogutta sp.]
MSGVVQGIGFRPFVYRLAHKWGVSGWIQNTTDGVTIEVEGTTETLEGFWADFWNSLPAGSCFDSCHRDEIPVLTQAQPPGFRIITSDGEGKRRPNIPPDLAVCEECRKEMSDPQDRRYRYPFINCTHCGPRWSIVEGVPYDRPLTSMRNFEMCATCQGEYENPLDRRFHAQPIACPQCGPHLELWNADGRVLAVGESALRQAAAAVLAGQILALKGLGGFQLICDATNDQAVAQLRSRKRRPHKPFAVMMTDAMLVQFCVIADESIWTRLRSAASPILLLPRRPGGGSPGEPCPYAICQGVAPNNPYLGVMLPYTPLHHLLMDLVCRPVVCTSGNISEEPMAIDNEEAVERLSGIADLFLVHNRPIVRPVDDSVMATDRSGKSFMIRRARGFAPRAIMLPGNHTPILATGGHLKNVVGLAIGPQAILSGHIGDLDNSLASLAHQRAIEDLLKFFAVTPEFIACDLHPDYASTRSAETLAQQLRIPVYRWQHHLAHFAACLAEREGNAYSRWVSIQNPSGAQYVPAHADEQRDFPVLGAIWDGTGYGTDGTVWGGEFFLFDGIIFRRVARLRIFPLPGGDLVVRQPRRSLLGLIHETGDRWGEQLLNRFFTDQEQKILIRAMERNVQSPRTSSMGRLFDGIAALLGFGEESSFEGQAAMALQFAAEKVLFTRGGHFPEKAMTAETKELDSPSEFLAKAWQMTETTGVAPLELQSEDKVMEVDWRPLLRSVLAAYSDGMNPEALALAFHVRLVEIMFRIHQDLKCGSLLISGGCFHNQLLRYLTAAEASRRGIPLYQSESIPAGDGGIALGQLWLTARTVQGAIRADAFCNYLHPRT